MNLEWLKSLKKRQDSLREKFSSLRATPVYDVALSEVMKYLTALNDKDITLGLESLQNLRKIMDAEISESSLDELFYTGEIEYFNRSFCFTGIFDFGDRSTCETAVTKQGGQVKKSVIVRLDYLVVGNEVSPDWYNHNYGRKIEKALDIKSGAGNNAKPFIIHESHWIKSFKQ
jgi:NAD-dependent DNA ligase